jgi:hypothetical protein
VKNGALLYKWWTSLREINDTVVSKSWICQLCDVWLFRRAGTRISVCNAGSSTGNTVGLHSGGARFECRPGTGYPDTFLVVFLSPARQCRDSNDGYFAKPPPPPPHTHTHTHTHVHCNCVLKLFKFPASVFSEIVISSCNSDDVRSWCGLTEGGSVETAAGGGNCQIFLSDLLSRISSVIYIHTFYLIVLTTDRLCGLVVRVPGYRFRGPEFDSRRYQIFWEVVGLERGPLSLLRITEELLDWKSSGSSEENRINGRGDPLRWPRHTLYPQKLALTSPTSGGRSVGIVRLRTTSHGA